jgi:hypothetical protein
MITVYGVIFHEFYFPLHIKTMLFGPFLIMVGKNWIISLSGTFAVLVQMQLCGEIYQYIDIFKSFEYLCRISVQSLVVTPVVLFNIYTSCSVDDLSSYK